jgi:adenylate cyclase
MATEIERKFLIPDAPPLDGAPGQAIEQGYLAVDPNGTEVRVRRSAGRCRLGVKSGSGLVRTEVETDITQADFAALWPATGERRLEKTRHTVDVHGHTVEVDIYSGALSGLTVAEVEFTSREEAERFRPPAWFGREVTGQTRYLNRELALRPPTDA